MTAGASLIRSAMHPTVRSVSGRLAGILSFQLSTFPPPGEPVAAVARGTATPVLHAHPRPVFGHGAGMGQTHPRYFSRQALTGLTTGKNMDGR